MSEWRVGRNNSLNVYDGDRPVCQCHTTEDAAGIVSAVNLVRKISAKDYQPPNPNENLWPWELPEIPR